MITGQIFLWILLSIASGLATYLILTEGKNNYLLIMTFFFSLFFGIATSYIWLQTTNGLAAFGWGVAVLPVLFSFIAELLLVSIYAYYHKKDTLPKVPKFTYTKTASLTSLAVIFILSFLLASFYVIPSEATQTGISILGSSNTETLDVSQVLSADLPETPSQEITIQSSVITPISMRENAKLNENLNFKVEFTPQTSFTQPALYIFVQDSEGELINQNNIILSSSQGNVAEGQILCDETGLFTLTAVVYDLSVSSTVPLASSTHTYVVQGVDTEDEGTTSTMLLFVALCISISIFLVLALFYKINN